MAEEKLVLISSAEIRARPKFDPDCSVTVENLKCLVAEYHIREPNIHCQVERGGHRCKQEHFNGWLARRKDGYEGLIGNDCGVLYFNADDTFRAERHRLANEITVQGHIRALAELLRDRPGLFARVEGAHQRLLAARQKVRELETGLPVEAVSRLLDMAKRRNGKVFVEIRRVEIEKDERGNEKERFYWDPRDVGTLVGLELWDSTPVQYLFATLPRIKDAAANAQPSRGYKVSQLRDWREKLEELPHCEEILQTLERAIADFCTPVNMKLVCHLVRGSDRQREVALLALRQSGELVSNTKASAFLDGARSLVRQQYGNRDFRVM